MAIKNIDHKEILLRDIADSLDSIAMVMKFFMMVTIISIVLGILIFFTTLISA